MKEVLVIERGMKKVGKTTITVGDKRNQKFSTQLL